MIYLLITLLLLISIFFLSYYFLFIKKDIPFLGIRDSEWSIGIYDFIYNCSNFVFSERTGVQNPIITAQDTGLKDAQFVADPFIFQYQGNYYLFFEIMRSEKGVIGLATSSDSYNWRYESIILEEPFHLSYPSIFEHKNKIFILPETSQTRQVRIYSSVDFPHKWKFEKILLEGKEWFDPSIVQINGVWYLFLGIKNNRLELYFSSNLFDGWKEHPKSPIVENNIANARPAGRPMLIANNLFRFAQDCSERYGEAVKVFEITKIDVENYSEKEIDSRPILTATGSSWNGLGMHHLSFISKDDRSFIAAIDGNKKLEQPILFFLAYKIRISNFIYNKIMNVKKKGFFW